jgi:hypothetical protein
MSSTEIQRPNVQDVKPFWPADRTRLTVSITPASGKLTVTGFDPDQSTTVPVFTATIDTAQEPGFLEAVRVGTAGVPVPNENKPSGGAGNAIVVSDPGGGGDFDGPDVEYWSVPLTAGLVAHAARTARPTGT